MENYANIAFIGLGGRGYGLLKNLLRMSDVRIISVCDSYLDRAERGAAKVKAVTGKSPICSTDYREVIGLEEVNCVVIATSWEDHLKIAIESMRLGKFVATEVGGAYKLQDCFDLVKTYEETGCHCMMLENCCYGKYELMVTNMVRKGLFGEIVHCEGGYCHDLRGEITGGEENRHYRLRNYLNRNCENYPTHEFGPIAKIINLNDGNRALSLYSVSSKARGLKEYIEQGRCKNEKLKSKEFKQGDIVTTVIKCQNGETITLSLDTTLPRTYSRRFTIRGTKGAYYEDTNTIFIDGKCNHSFKPSLYWNNAKKYLHSYKSSLWRGKGWKRAASGHGGMDYVVLRALVETVKNNAYPPIDTYDTALWMCITPLSEKSIETGASVEMPDFTNGKWQKSREELKGIISEYSLQ